MIKPVFVLLGLSVFSGAICADPTDPCAGLDGSSLSQCRSTQQTLQQQQQLERLLQQQQERQNQLDQQQREVQQQLESMRLQNENLRKQLEREAANQAAQPVTTNASKGQDALDAAKTQDLETWKADHPWFGRDYSRTQFAMRYIKKLQKERPDLGERELLDAVSTKVDETFGPKQ